MRGVIGGGSDLADDGTLFFGEDQDREALDAIERIRAQRSVIKAPAKVGVSVFVELDGTTVETGIDFDVHTGHTALGLFV